MSVSRTGDRCITRAITRDITESPVRVCSGSGPGPGPEPSVATFIASFVGGSACPTGTSPVGTYTYSRTGVTQTIIDFEGITKATQTREIGFQGQRRVENLADNTLSHGTQDITVIVGHVYQVTIQEGNGEQATTATASNAFTGELTASDTSRISWANGTPKTATSTTLTITVAGTLNELLVEDVTDQTIQVPSEEVSGTEHCTNVEDVMYKNYANEITVNGSGVVDESGNPGTSFAIPFPNKGVVLWASGENFADTDDANTQTIDLTGEATGDYVFSVKGSASFTISGGTSTLSSFDFTATEASPCNFSMDVAGTVVCTLDSGTLDTDQAGNYLVQLEAGLCTTAFVPSPTTTPAVRNEADLSYDSDNYTDQGWAVCEFDVTQCELDRVAELGAPLILTLFSIQDNDRGRWLFPRIQQDSSLDAVLRVSSKGTGLTNSQDHAITVGHHIISMTWDSSDGTLRQSFDGNSAVGATIVNSVMLAATATKFLVGNSYNVGAIGWLDGTENSIQIGTGLIDDAELVTKSTVTLETLPITAGNFPSAVSVFDNVPARVAGVTVSDALSSPTTLTYDTDSDGYRTSTGTVFSSGVVNSNFNETNAQVKAALDGPAAEAPIIFLATCKWEGTQEAYGRSIGYGDWVAGTNDYVYVGATDEAPPSNDLWGSAYVDSKGPISATYVDAIDFTGGTITSPSWYSHLVLVDPTTSDITMYSLKEGSSTVNKVTDSGAAFTNGFTFELTGTNVTYHKCDLAFMGMFYPDVLPTDDEARAIIAYHYEKQTAKEKVLHPWFNNRARYVSLIPDGSIIDPSDSASIVDPDDGTTYIIEA